jgi:hypothetical protein
MSRLSRTATAVTSVVLLTGVTECLAQRSEEAALLHRSRRYLRMAGALALAGGSLLAGGAPAAATADIAIGPMLHSRFMSATQPPTPAQCEAVFTAPC